jgi:translocation and assembly module TamB
LFGELNILSGDIEVFGQNLTIQQGNLSFAGEPDNPSLNIRAEREIREESIRVGVDALGNLEAISFHLYSSPPMSENEMMSYLLRGRGLDAGAEGDGAGAAQTRLV